MWSKINKVLQNKKSLDETFHICDNGMTISDPTNIADKFSNYGPFLWKEFNCLKVRATSRRQFTFYC